MRKEMRNLCAAVLSCLFSLAVLSGCSSGGTSSKGLEIKIFKPDPQYGHDPLSEKVKLLKISVTGFDIPKPVTKIVDKALGSAQISGIPYGYARYITVEGCTMQCSEIPGDIVSKGTSMKVTVKPGDEPKKINIFMSEINTFNPVTSVNTGMKSTLFMKERVGATITALDDGRILITGGAQPTFDALGFENESDLEMVIDSAEIFDPNTGEFSPLDSKLSVPRAFHAAVKLNDGRVVLLGGITDIGGVKQITRTVDLFDPVTKQFTQQSNQLSTGRAFHTADLINKESGLIFVAGGKGIAKSGWEIWSITNGTVGAGGLKGARWNHTSTMLDSYGKSGEDPGKPVVMLIGGEDGVQTLDRVEVFDINANKIEDEAMTIPGGGRTLNSSVWLKEQGIVYVIGGFSDIAKKSPIDRIDIFREGIKSFTGEMLKLKVARGGHSAVIMEHNAILIAGGRGVNGALNTAEIIIEFPECSDPDNPNTCYYKVDVVSDGIPQLISPRFAHKALFLDTKTVLLLGGFRQGPPYLSTDIAEIYNPMTL